MKRKLNTKNKNYPLEKSPLFRVTYTKRLISLLNLEDTIDLSKEIPQYRTFIDNGRQIQTPIGRTHNIHNRIASLLSRFEHPSYVHSGRKGYSYKTNAIAHKHSICCLTMDIKAFFPSISNRCIFKFFRNQMKCSHEIANILATLCTIDGHLPTGSQLSMPLAFWANHNMFDELYKLASTNNLIMTLYVDDLTFSGSAIPKNFQYKVTSILKGYGYQIKTEKTRLYLANQPKEITGLIINQGEITLPSRQYQKLHTSLNSVKDNPTEQNIKSVQGRLNYVSLYSPGYRNIQKKIKQVILSNK